MFHPGAARSQTMVDQAHPRSAGEMSRAADHRRLCADVLKFLQEHGPTDFAALVHGLQTTTGRLSQAGRTLQDSGAIYRYRAYPGRDSRRIWSLNPQPMREQKSQSKPRTPGIGMDAEHLQWMETYRQKAEIRRQRISLETPDWSAA